MSDLTLRGIIVKAIVLTVVVIETRHENTPFAKDRTKKIKEMEKNTVLKCGLRGALDHVNV